MTDIEFIAQTCLHTDCVDCPFYDAYYRCLVRTIPEFWKTDRIGEILEHEKEELRKAKAD